MVFQKKIWHVVEKQPGVMVNFLNIFLGFFLPSFCTHCHNKLRTDEKFICSGCFAKINTADKRRIQSEYEKKFRDKEFVAGFTTRFIFEKDKELQSLLHSLKYENKFLVGVYLGKILARANPEFFRTGKIDLVTPVPLHRLKKAERGYNQAYYIAKGISRQTKIPLANNLLKRVKFTRTQTKLNLGEREDNVRGAFKIRRPRRAKDKIILVIDDIITTGATTNECAKTLIESGANKIYAGSIALAD